MNTKCKRKRNDNRRISTKYNKYYVLIYFDDTDGKPFMDSNVYKCHYNKKENIVEFDNESIIKIDRDCYNKILFRKTYDTTYLIFEGIFDNVQKYTIGIQSWFSTIGNYSKTLCYSKITNDINNTKNE